MIKHNRFFQAEDIEFIKAPVNNIKKIGNKPDDNKERKKSYLTEDEETRKHKISSNTNKDSKKSRENYHITEKKPKYSILA